MNAYILRGEEFGHNTFHITNQYPELKVVKKGELPPTPDWVIRWGNQAKIANGPKIINKKSAIKETCNKGVFRKKAADKGLAPRTWLSIDTFLAWCNDEGADQAVSVIVRPHFHSRSEDLYFCKSKKELDDAIAKVGPDYYISEYIKKDREVRVFVANGRVMIVAEKKPKDKKLVTWGCVEEGILDYTFWEDWEEDIIRVAIESFNLSKLDFAAVDIMVKNGKAYFLECNTAPEVWAYYGECFGKVFKYMIENEKGRERIPVKDYKNWKNTIHPAISDKAII